MNFQKSDRRVRRSSHYNPSTMDRDVNFKDVTSRNEPFDFVIVGGGASGMGVALDAASRGFSCCLLEQNDFGKGTSSRSTKLIHGGVRYLRQGNISLVSEALAERKLLLKNAPHLVHLMPFVIPVYSKWDKFFYGTGLKVYDLLAGRNPGGKSRTLDVPTTLEKIPTAVSKNLSGGVMYFDAAFDDARLLIALARMADKHGAKLLNYAKVESIEHGSDGKVNGVKFKDGETMQSHTVRARCVINAAGPFGDAVRKLDDAAMENRIRPSQGAHVVLDRSYLPSDSAMLIPKTADGRLMFAIPWHEHVLVGTTDTDVQTATLEPRPLDEEIDFLLATAGRYLSKQPTRADVKSAFAGIRPLVKRGLGKTSALSRDFEVEISPNGLVSLMGGKWTSYRAMAEKCVDRAIESSGLLFEPCMTRDLPIEDLHGHDVTELAPSQGESAAEVLTAVRYEMARTVEDVLARRLRTLQIDAREAIRISRDVAMMIAEHRQLPNDWVDTQVREFESLARGYLV